MFVDNAFLLFFVNGLAFFVLGLTISLELRRVQFFQISGNLWLLAGYAYVAALGNWLEMVLLVQASTTPTYSLPVLQALTLALFVLACVSLLQFGLSILHVGSAHARHRHWAFVLLFVVYLLAVALILLGPARQSGDWLPRAEALARTLLYLPGFVLSGIGLWRQRALARDRGLDALARYLALAAVVFWLKALVSGGIPIPILGLSGAQPLVIVVSVQFLRTLTTVAIAVLVVKILDSANLERQRQMSQVIEDRLQAQKEALEAQRLTCDEIRQWSASMTHMVQRISSAISEPLDIDEIMDLVLREMVRMAGLEKGVAMLLDEEKQELYLVAHTGVPDWFHQALARVRVGDGLAGWVAAKGEVLIVADILNDPRPFVPRTTDVLQFYAGIPLKAGGRVVGVINMAHGKEHSLSLEQVALLSAAGQQLGVAIEATRMNAQLRGLAALEERARLSRDLHDNLLQVLAYLHLKSQIAQRLLAQDRMSETLNELKEVEKASSQAYDDVRDTISGLRVTLSTERSLLDALQEHVRLFQERNPILVTVDDTTWHSLALPHEAEVQLLRIVQEAMTNVRRHAQSTRVWLTLATRDGVAAISVRDDGLGFDPARVGQDAGQHLGLQTMKERAEGVGAQLHVSSIHGQGTEVVVELPLRHERG